MPGTIHPHPDHEGFPMNDELRQLDAMAYTWVSQHGVLTPADGVVGFGPDGNPIADDPTYYKANLPVEKLRARVPRALAVLGVHQVLEVRVAMPFYAADPAEDDTETLTPQTVQFAHNDDSRVSI